MKDNDHKEKQPNILFLINNLFLELFVELIALNIIIWKAEKLGIQP